MFSLCILLIFLKSLYEVGLCRISGTGSKICSLPFRQNSKNCQTWPDFRFNGHFPAILLLFFRHISVSVLKDDSWLWHNPKIQGYSCLPELKPQKFMVAFVHCCKTGLRRFYLLLRFHLWTILVWDPVWNCDPTKTNLDTLLVNPHNSTVSPTNIQA